MVRHGRARGVFCIERYNMVALQTNVVSVLLQPGLVLVGLVVLVYLVLIVRATRKGK